MVIKNRANFNFQKILKIGEFLPENYFFQKNADGGNTPANLNDPRSIKLLTSVIISLSYQHYVGKYVNNFII